MIMHEYQVILDEFYNGIMYRMIRYCKAPNKTLAREYMKSKYPKHTIMKITKLNNHALLRRSRFS